MQAHHRIPAMLNFSAGNRNVLLACKTAQIKRVYTSKRFVHLGGLESMIEVLVQNSIKIIYLEDVKAKINGFHKLKGLLAAKFPALYYRFTNRIKKRDYADCAKKPSVILFTSGSEGVPKGVVLSHANIQANRFQLMARVSFLPLDRVFNSLPMFHAFGLTTATLLPVVCGMRVFMYPSPLHYKIIPELCYDIDATILFGTDTFLFNYGKYAHPYDFYSIRYVFAGAEKIRKETHQMWEQKFGIRIFEGYGTTETTPVLTMNTPMQYKMGTVGRLLPGIRYRLQAVDGINDGAKLQVSGENKMLGYIFADGPGKIVAAEEFYDTGDIVTMDEEGYITIKGRAKRFAKIAGEMISLSAVEEAIRLLWPEYQHGIVSKPDVKKGEQIVLVTNYKEAEASAILLHFRAIGFAEISLPRKIIYLEQLPVLGSGKTDYLSMQNLVTDPSN